MTRRKFRPLRRRTGEGLHPSAGKQAPVTTDEAPAETQQPQPDGHAPKKPKTPPSLTRYFPIAGLHEATILRLGGVEVSIMEVRGLEVEQPIMGAFAAVLNALDFPVQLLVRQHPPRLGALRDSLAERRPSGLAEGVAQASASLGEFLGELEERPGVVDRRFYAIALNPNPPREGVWLAS